MMRRRSVAAFVLAVAFAAAPGDALGEAPGEVDRGPGSIRVHGGYVTGSEYLDMNGLEKRAYIGGLIDGMLLAPAFGGDEDRMAWFLECTAEMKRNEIRSALFNYINARGELWDNANPAKMYRAIDEACRKRAKTGPKPE